MKSLTPESRAAAIRGELAPEITRMMGAERDGPFPLSEATSSRGPDTRAASKPPRAASRAAEDDAAAAIMS